MRRGGSDGGSSGVCRVCADRQQRVRVDEHSGTATGAKSSSLQQQQRRQASERGRQRDREREGGRDAKI